MYPIKNMYKMKIPLLGEGAVGKSTLVKAFMGGKMTRGYTPTVGVDVGKKDITLDINGDSAEVNFQLWDLAGQASFQKIRTVYYRGAVGLILVYDISRRDTFEACERWLEEAWSVVGKIPTVLVGNKLDLRQIERGEISYDEGEELAKRIQEKTKQPTLFVETSAIRRKNADTPFKDLAKTLILKHQTLKKR